MDDEFTIIQKKSALCTRHVDEVEAFPLFEQHGKDRIRDRRASADKEARQQRRGGGGQRAHEWNGDLRGRGGMREWQLRKMWS